VVARLLRVAARRRQSGAVLTEACATGCGRQATDMVFGEPACRPCACWVAETLLVLRPEMVPLTSEFLRVDQ
jgi:hypothetical protein